MLQGAANKVLDDFEILGRTYLDPFLERRNLFWIGIFERLENDDLCRVFRRLTPSRLEINSNDDSSLFPQSTSHWNKPISFNKKSLGIIRVEETEKNSSIEIQKSIEAIADQMAPLFDWTNPSWNSRLQVLEYLQQLKNRETIFDWVGVYRLDESKKDLLTVSAYIGLPTEHIKIPISKGICGAAIREEKTINVPRVRADRRFISCSLNTQSELVVPIRNAKNQIVAEIDVDSDTVEAFTPERVALVEAFAEKISKIPDLF